MIFSKQLEGLYRSNLFVRYDGNECAYYFSAKDFPNLQAKSYHFANQNGERLQGYFYCYPNPIPNRIVVFDHGIGGGHRSYMKEIEMLAHHGYLVFAYDHTGCMESEGAFAGGLTQSLPDLDACISTLKADKNYQGYTLSVIGHSWGGYACLNIAAYHPDLAHIVAISGFISVKQMHRQLFRGVQALLRKSFFAIEKSAHPNYAETDAVSALSKTNARILIIHSDDDDTVHCKYHFSFLEKALHKQKNIQFLKIYGKAHNPHYTSDAIQYKKDYYLLLQKKTKRKELVSKEQKEAFIASIDWNRMTVQDEKIWKEIFEVLNK